MMSKKQNNTQRSSKENTSTKSVLKNHGTTVYFFN